MSRFFNLFTEIIGWLQIADSPFLIGLAVAALLYFQNPSDARFILAVIITFAGLITGIIWATRVWKRKGTIQFLSRISATPELDNKEEEHPSPNSPK